MMRSEDDNNAEWKAEIKYEKISYDFPPDEVFKVDLSADELEFLLEKLPKGYSFQVQPRKKDQKVYNVRKKVDESMNSNSQVQQNPQKSASVPKPKANNPPPPQPSKKITKQDLILQSLKPCQKTLASLIAHKSAWPFLQPVDVEAFGIPEYNEIVKEPMDFSTIDNKLKTGKYNSPQQFHQDVIKIFHNSYLFNQANEEFLKITAEIERYYYRISGETKQIIEKPVVVKPPVATQSKSQKKKKRLPPGSRELNQSQPITPEEKRELAHSIHRLAKEHIKGIRSIVFEPNCEQMEFDIQLLPQKKIRELQKYVRGKIADMETNLRFNVFDKSEERNLDEMQSEITEKFLDDSDPSQIKQ